MRWVIHGGEATLRDDSAGTVEAIVRQKGGYWRVFFRSKNELRFDRPLPQRSVSMEKMMALALAHVKMR